MTVDGAHMHAELDSPRRVWTRRATPGPGGHRARAHPSRHRLHRATTFGAPVAPVGPKGHPNRQRPTAATTTPPKPYNEQSHHHPISPALPSTPKIREPHRIQFCPHCRKFVISRIQYAELTGENCTDSVVVQADRASSGESASLGYLRTRPPGRGRLGKVGLKKPNEKPCRA